jgi:hypothetical protein
MIYAVEVENKPNRESTVAFSATVATAGEIHPCRVLVNLMSRKQQANKEID